MSRHLAIAAFVLTLFYSSAAVAAAPGTDSPNGPPEKLHGRVLQPNGAPAADALVLVSTVSGHPVGQTRSDAQGNFEVKIDTAALLKGTEVLDWRRGSIAAGKPGVGPAWIVFRHMKELSGDQPITLQLADDVPIRGRILDQQGRPVVGAEIKVVWVHGGQDKLDGFLKANRDNPTRLWLFERDEMQYLPPKLLPLLGGDDSPGEIQVKTDKNGSFELTGIGAERSVRLRVTGPDISTESLYVVTRTTIDARWERGALSRITRIYVNSGAALPTVYPAEFRHLAEPGLTLRGTVKDIATGKPVPGMNVSASIRSSTNGASAKTDEQGRYELSGLKLEGNLTLSVLNPGDQPYIDTTRKMLLRADQPPGEVHFEVTRGVVISGRVTERETGIPVRGHAQYLAWAGNEELKKLPGSYDSNNTMMTDENGKYRLVVPRGPGVLAFAASERRYEPAQPEDFELPIDSQRGTAYFSSVNAGLVSPSHFHAVRKIEPSSDKSELRIDLEVWSGNPIKGRVVDLQNRPVTEVEADGLVRGQGSRLADSTFAIHGLKPGAERTVFFRDRDHQLAAIVTFKMPKQGAPEPQTVQLLPAGVVSGRLVDENGRPRSQWGVGVLSAGVVKTLRGDRNANKSNTEGLFEFGDTTTDADGYFRITGVPAGVSFEVAAGPKDPNGFSSDVPQLVHKGSVRSGQQLDLGELRTKSPGKE
jgi:hypothetical protein